MQHVWLRKYKLQGSAVTGSSVLASQHTFLVAGLLVPYDGDGILLNEVSPMRGRALPGLEHKGTIQSFCESRSTAVNKAAGCGSNN